MKEKPTILIVDDDRGIRELLQDFLQQHEFRVVTANDGGQMEAVLKKHDVDLIILDVMLPGKDGLILCQELRQRSKLPIIMLTAVSEEIDCILGLEMGADDYISKPFNPRTLLARIKAVLRRVDSHVSIDEQDLPVYLFSGWRLDTAKRKLLAPDGVEILLSTGEYNLLHAFVKRPQQVLSRDLLLDITKNREAGPYDRSIDIQISRLRQKLEVNPKKPEIIKTVRGGGYVLSTVVEY